MFLLYRNQGKRRYGLEPIQPYPRGAWEFQFFLEGECDFLVREKGAMSSERVIGPALIITAPDCVHGWGGKPGDTCENMIFHFDEVDFTVRTILGKEGWRKVSFRSGEIATLQLLYERCAEARKAIGTTPLEVRKRAGFFEPLIYRIVATELTLFFLKHLRRAELGLHPNYGETKVTEAIGWYEANLSRSPNIVDVAAAIHISPTHLRRLFHKIRGESPQTAFTRLQFERAKWLMREPGMTLEQIAESAGFGSGSAFSRAFKSEFQLSPRAYREMLSRQNAHREKLSK